MTNSDEEKSKWKRFKVIKALDEMIKIRPEHSTEHQELWIKIDQPNMALGGTHTKEGYLDLTYSDNSPLKFEEDGD